VRQELYLPPHQKNLFKSDYRPYESGADFHYRPQWTGRYYTLLRQVIKALMLDPHVELQRAWSAIIAAGGPEKVPQAMAEFNKIPFVYADAAKAAASLQISKENSASQVASVLRRWSEDARNCYLRAEELAKEGK